MTRRTFVAIPTITVLLASPFYLSAQQPDSAAMQQIRPATIHAHMAFLADDLLEGRGTGTRGHELAARYVAFHFEAMGLEPAGVEHTWFQPVPLRRSEVQPVKCSMSLIRDGREQTLEFGKDYAAGGSSRYEQSTVQASLVFVGYGVSAPSLNYDDHAGADVRGKIAVVLNGAPSRFPSTERAHTPASPSRSRQSRTAPWA
jgi:hypothetical protein